jgi:hypothetical protein
MNIFGFTAIGPLDINGVGGDSSQQIRSGPGGITQFFVLGVCVFYRDSQGNLGGGCTEGDWITCGNVRPRPSRVQAP